ncbi:MAG: restriction endonuclease subunit S, partial [Oscillospiraceae bacterium]|nr:restriction endonuclease subunit S [Oscillospiraceae bacterium]
VYGIRDGKSIDVDGMKTIQIPYPKIEEQQAIGNYFKSLDNLITLHQRKYSLLFIRTFEILKEACFFLNVNAWEQREFNSVFTMLQNNTLSRAELAADNGAAMNVHYGDILVKFSEVLDLEIEALPYIESEQVVSKFKSSYLQNGDVIVADTAEDEAVGKCTEIANLSDVTVISGLHTIPLRPQQKFASGYLGYYLNSNSYHDTLIPLMQGTKVTSISKSALQGTSICYPTSYDEQQQIGSYFRNLDNLITLHQRKPFQRKNGGKNYVRRC